MAQISVKPDSLTVQEMGLFVITTRLQAVENELNSLKRQISYNNSSEAYRSLARRIDSTVTGLDRQRASISSMKNVLAQVKRLYKNTEKAVDGNFHQKSSVDWSQTTASGAKTALDIDGWNSNWNSFWKNMKEDGKFDDSVADAAIGISTAAAGQEIKSRLETQFVNLNAKHKSGSTWDYDKGNLKVSEKISGELNILKVSGEEEHGIVKNEAEAALLTGAGSGEAYFALMKDGKFEPSIGAEAKINGNVINGSVSTQIGNDDVNLHGKAKGELISGEAKAGFKIGKDGVKAEAGAEAYLAKGEIEGGFEFLGVKIDATIEGKAGALGGKGSASASGTSAEGEIGASLGLGLGLKVKVDWSEAAKRVEKMWNNQPSWVSSGGR